ncbi:MAG: RluA family pseudouridine synthase [Desulfocapsa sp.]|nr:RluA family pseudouridine synthase [Desulfocapsa sp.]
MQRPDKQEAVHCNITVKAAAIACQLLADTTGLPKERIKHAMVKGAVWLKRPGSKERRLRKAKFKLKTDDFVQLFYDADVLSQTPPEPKLIADYEDYSIWFKPPWLLSQGTRYGDHCSLLRLAQKGNINIDFKMIHRLDREASGLMILAHNRNAAMLLSNLFQEDSIEKRYFAEVKGHPEIPSKGLMLTSDIDEKNACTEILKAYPGKTDKSNILDIRLHTGRLHQIRRHLAEFGYPVIGDPKYGEPQRGHYELHLCAWKISFISPFTKKKTTYQAPRDMRPSFLNEITMSS